MFIVYGTKIKTIKMNISENCIMPPAEVSSFELFCCIYCRCGFSVKEELLSHQEMCNYVEETSSNSKKVENLHFRVIKQMKKKDSSEDRIIQPGPDLPKGQYWRRRAYRAEHKNSWKHTLEKYKYVKCIYQNCYFIAMSLEDMIAHFGYCNGDGSFAKFVCPFCQGRVTSESILLKHIERSHYKENNHIKVGPLMIQKYLKSKAVEAQNREEENLESNLNSLTPEKHNAEELSSHKEWQDQIDEYGYAFCINSSCNFMAQRISDLETHLKTCDGTPEFEFLNCQKCRYRLPTKEDLAQHVPLCDDKKMRTFSTFDNEFSESPKKNLEEDFEIGPVFRQYQSKRPKINADSNKVNASSNTVTEPVQDKKNSPKNIEMENTNDNSQNSVKDTTKQKTRGRPKKTVIETEQSQNGEFKCGKCDFRGTKNGFVYHNMKTHVGLGWLEGEKPVDLNDEKLVIRLVKEAFKLTKKAACEKCDDVKRSVLGFVSHIQNCGKSHEEKNALKVQCPHCEGKYMKYSLASHIKLIHSSPQEKEDKTQTSEEVSESAGKRRSAIKAASKFQGVFSESEDTEVGQKSPYVFYERGSERTPKLNWKLNNLWYKLKREKKKIPCRHLNCNHRSKDVKEAKTHHYNCPLLPEKVYMCELCDFYSVDEPNVQSHVLTHRKYFKQKKTGEEGEDNTEEDFDGNEDDDEGDECAKEDEDEDADVEGEEEEEEEFRTSEEELEDSDEPRKRKKKKEGSNKARKKLKSYQEYARQVIDIEFRLKQNFCRREKIDNIRGIQFYSKGLEMTLKEEISTLEKTDSWPELHTTLHDWLQVPPQQAVRYFPELSESVSVRFPEQEAKWKRFQRFEGDVIEGVPVMFTGGSVRSLSWCKISFKRMIEKTQRQYLAVSTAKKLDHLKDIFNKSSLEKSTLLQIWDCGALVNDLGNDIPKFSLGILQKGGEIWDLAWFPEDFYVKGSEKRMTRLGLLATACEDGAVRVWSICDPVELEITKGLRIYITEPVVILTTDKDVKESCLHLSVGLNGIIAGGFENGTVAIWNLKNVSSPFCKKKLKTKILRAHLVFQAHKTAITALTFCPSNSRYISTAGLDRFVKIWDLEFPSVPLEQYNKDYSLDNIWTMNWPTLIYNFDDVVVNFNKGAVKFIKDILTDRHQSSFAMEDACLTMAFSDWLNTLCGGSLTGEVKIKLLKNLIHDQKKYQSTISSLKLVRLKGLDSKEQESSGNNENSKEKIVPKTYDEVHSGYGLVFKDNLGVDKGKPKKPEAHPEDFPIRAVNKIAFNPNFISFTHIALGYNCGLIRIQCLKELQSAKSLKFFIEKARKEKF